MKKINIFKLVFAVGFASFLFVQCEDADDFGNAIAQETCDDGIQNGGETSVDCGGPDCAPCSQTIDFSGRYVQADQMGRPAVSVMFASVLMKDSLNVTVPSQMAENFQLDFEQNLLLLNPDYTTNILGQDSTAVSTMFSKNVLWLAQTGETTYYDGTNVMTGRKLADDAIDFNLLLIYGGPSGTENDNDPVEEPLLVRDGVDANDAVFSSSFPYVVPAFEE